MNTNNAINNLEASTDMLDSRFKPGNHPKFKSLFSIIEIAQILLEKDFEDFDSDNMIELLHNLNHAGVLTAQFTIDVLSDSKIITQIDLQPRKIIYTVANGSFIEVKFTKSSFIKSSLKNEIEIMTAS